MRQSWIKNVCVCEREPVEEKRNGSFHNKKTEKITSVWLVS